MAFESFRDWVELLEKAGELIRISHPVATELEITEIADREMKKPGGGKALLFEKPTVLGVVSPFPVAINTLGSWKRMAMSMNAASVDDVAAELGGLMKARPPASMKEALRLLSLALDLRHAKPKTVKSGPCKEVIHRFDAPTSRREAWPDAPDWRKGTDPLPPTLADLPILKCWPLDGGRFITLPCVVTQDPDTGGRNLGMYRIQVYDDRTTGVHWQLQKVAARHGRRYYETGQRMPVAIFLGGDPMFPFAATAPLPDGLDEFLLAGYLRKKAVELVKCETNDLEVPADAEIILEGVILPDYKVEEGPFGPAVHGVVDGHVHRAQLILHRLHEPLHRSVVRHVTLCRHDFHPQGACLGGHLFQLPELGAGADRQVGALTGKGDGGQTADVAAGTGDEYRLAPESCVHGDSPCCIE